MKAIKILLLEDDPNDVILITRVLSESTLFQVDLKVADKRDVFHAALETFIPDIILSDYRLPQFSGLEALYLVLEVTPSTPFIFITGAIGEELAAETVLSGAWGFILKNNLASLPATINACLLKSQKKNIPSPIKEFTSTSGRIRRQIEINKLTLEKAKQVVVQNKSEADILEQIKAELNNSQEELERIHKRMKNDPSS